MDVSVAQAFTRIRSKLLFLYDYGDKWRFNRLRKNPRTIQFSLRFRMPERLEMSTSEVNPRDFQSQPTKIMSQGRFRTDSGCRYAAAPSSLGSRIRS